jgi:heat-inducible transcriptional repressor
MTMYVTDYNQRRNRILESIIEAYVSTASPVGSELIARKLRSTLSPATIRNIMVELEEAGYVEQPHTSAGRVPTFRGYRYYVDSLMEVRKLSAEQLQQMIQLVQPEEMEVELLLDRVSEVLAELTQQAAFVVAPTVRQSTVRQIELVPLSVRKILCVLVTNHEEMFASHVVEVEEPISRDEAAALVRFINTQLAGLPFNDVIGSLERRLLAESDTFYHLVKRSLDILQHALSTEPEERFFLEGTSYVVAQPEFRRDPKKAHQLLKSLESQHELSERVRRDLSRERVQVRIGDEIQVPGYEGCSYVTAPFLLDGRIAGGVGVLGPTRMDYPRMSAWVEGMARALTEVLAEGTGS